MSDEKPEVLEQDEHLQSESSFHAVVIGTGASGTLVAAQLHRLAPHLRLALVGDAPRPARGVAYETPYRANLLNVPAGKMSAFPEDADHFVHWLTQHLPGADEETFSPRLLFGNYLAGIFDEATHGSHSIEHFRDQAIGLTKNDGVWSVALKSGRSIQATHVVFAFGNLQTPGDPINFEAVASKYWRNPWKENVAKDLDPEAPVLLIGTGLTMADVALSLREVGHRGPIHTLSRHGRLYQSHAPYRALPLPILTHDFDSPVGALRWVRREIRSTTEPGGWRAVIDSLRPHTTKIWQGWRLAQRRTFLRHARNLWDTHRHRMAPEIARQLNSLLESGILTIHRGHLIAARLEGSQAVVEWKNAEGEIRTLAVARIVNCTGPSRDYSFNRSPLIARLRSDGLMTPDALRLGFETDAEGRFVGAEGTPVKGLFTLGPPRIPALWESIAIPEIRDQALTLAQTLISEIAEP